MHSSDTVVQTNQLRLSSGYTINELRSSRHGAEVLTEPLGVAIKENLEAIVETRIFQENNWSFSPRSPLSGRTTNLKIRQNEVYLIQQGREIPLIRTAREETYGAERQILTHHAREIIRKAQELEINKRSNHYTSQSVQTVSLAIPKKDQRIAALEEELLLEQEQTGNAREELQKVSHERDLLRNEVTLLKERLSLQEVEMGELLGENYNLKNEVTRLRLALQKAEADLEIANKKVLLLTQALDQAEKRAAKAAESYEALRIELDLRKAEFVETTTANQRTIIKLKHELSLSLGTQTRHLKALRDAEETRSSALSDAQSKTIELEALKKKNLALQNRVQHLEEVDNKLALTEAQLKQLQRQASSKELELQRTIAQLTKKLSTTSVENEQLRRELTSALKENDALHYEILTLKLLLEQKAVELFKAEEALVLAEEVFAAKLTLLKREQAEEIERLKAKGKHDLETLQSEHEFQIAQLALKHKEKLDALSNEIIELNSSLQRVYELLETSEEKVAHQSDLLEKARRELVSAKETFAQEREVLEKKIEEITQYAMELHDVNEENQTLKLRLKSDKEEYELQLANLKLKHEEELFRLQEIINAKEREISILRKKLLISEESLRDKTLQLEEVRQSQEKARKAFSLHVDKLEAEIRKLQQNVNLQKEEIDALTETSSQNEVLIQEKIALLEDSQFQLSKALLEKEEMLNKICFLEERDLSLTDENNHYQFQIKQLRLEMSNLSSSHLEALELLRNENFSLREVVHKQGLQLQNASEYRLTLDQMLEEKSQEIHKLRLQETELRRELEKALQLKQEAEHSSEQLEKQHHQLSRNIQYLIKSINWRTYHGQTLQSQNDPAAALTGADDLHRLVAGELEARDHELDEKDNALVEMSQNRVRLEIQLMQQEETLVRLKECAELGEAKVQELTETNRQLADENEELLSHREEYRRGITRGFEQEQELAEARDLIQELKQEVDRLKRQYSYETENRKTLVKLNKEKAAKIESLKEEIDEADEEHKAALLAKDKEAEMNTSLLKSRIRELQDKIAILENQAALNQLEINYGIAENKAISKAFNEYHSNASMRIRELEDQVIDLKNLSERQAIELTSLKKQLQEKEALLGEYEDVLAIEQGAFATLESIKEPMEAIFKEAELEGVDQNYSALQSKIRALKEEVLELRKALAEKEHNSKEAAKDFLRFQEQIVRLQNEQISLKQEIALLKELMEKQSERIHDQAETISSLEKELLLAQQTRNAALQEARELRSELQDEKNSLTHKAETAQSFFDELTKVKKKLTSTDRDLKVQDVRVQELENRLIQKEALLKEKDQEIYRLRMENDRLRQENHELRELLSRQAIITQSLQLELLSRPHQIDAAVDTSSLMSFEEEEIPAIISPEPSVVEQLDVIADILREPITMRMSATNAHRLKKNQECTPNELTIEYKYVPAGTRERPIKTAKTKSTGETHVLAEKKLGNLGVEIGQAANAPNKDTFIRVSRSPFHGAYTQLNSAFQFLREEEFKEALLRIQEARGAGTEPAAEDVQIIQENTTRAIQELIRTCFTSTSSRTEQGMEMFPIMNLRCLLLYYRHYYPAGGKGTPKAIEKKINNIEQLINALDMFFSYVDIPSSTPSTGIVGETTVTFFAPKK